MSSSSYLFLTDRMARNELRHGKTGNAVTAVFMSASVSRLSVTLATEVTWINTRNFRCFFLLHLREIEMRNKKLCPLVRPLFRPEAIITVHTLCAAVFICEASSMLVFRYIIYLISLLLFFAIHDSSHGWICRYMPRSGRVNRSSGLRELPASFFRLHFDT